MSAIEYGSYYWCVVLRDKDTHEAGSSIHLHADHMSVDGSGNLIFKSLGRRPAGADPKKAQNGASDANPGEKVEKSENGENNEMIYFAVASNAWKLAYAAKLQDGAPASVEHWTAAEGREALPHSIPADAGARELPLGVVKL
jgi:hypothetical protein